MNEMIKRRVVVTGIGSVTPIGNNIKDTWDSVLNGKHGIGKITKFDTTDFKATIAAEVKDFSFADYCTDRSEARRTDPYAQYATAAAVQAVEDSNIIGNIEPERLGVYIGSGIGGMNTFVEQTLRLHDRGPSRVSPFFIPMMISNMASGTVAIRYNAMGPTLPAVTACATSSNTIGEAYRAVMYGYADAIIAGGAEATICPLAVAGFTSSMALYEGTDPDRASIPFDKERSGFVMGEGSSILIVEEYEHAVNRGAKIYAEIVGYGNTCDAYHITAPRPDGEGAANAFKLAINQAGITGGEDLYINAHGTSTHMNDAVETKAVKIALGEDEARKAKISSTKSMTGHMLGAAGATEAAFCVLALQNGVVPPTIGYKTPDPECDLDYTPNVKCEKNLKFALSSSLGFGGHNAVLAFKKI